MNTTCYELTQMAVSSVILIEDTFESTNIPQEALTQYIIDRVGISEFVDVYVHFEKGD